GASQADIDKAAGINLSLLLGVIMLVMGVIFIGWMLIRPPEVLHPHEMSEDDLPEQLRHHGLEAIPEHSSSPPPAEPPTRRRRRVSPARHPTGRREPGRRGSRRPSRGGAGRRAPPRRPGRRR